MKKLTTKLVLAAAALAAGAGTLSAQSGKADIPFQFHAGERVMAAGTYRVELTRIGGTSVFRFWNVDSNESATLLPQALVDPQREWTEGNATLAFTCTDGNCVLAEIWDGSGDFAYKFRHASPCGDEAAALREISIQPAKAE